jgi:TAZ zinc finger
MATVSRALVPQPQPPQTPPSKTKQQQQQQADFQLEMDRSKLVVLHHAATCPFEGVPTSRDTSVGAAGALGGCGCPTQIHCCAAKRLFGHMITCTKSGSGLCDVPGCHHARSVWKHYRKCPHPIHAQCELCNAVPHAYNPKSLCTRFRTSNSSTSSSINGNTKKGVLATDSQSRHHLHQNVTNQQHLTAVNTVRTGGMVLQSGKSFATGGYHYGRQSFDSEQQQTSATERIVAVWPLQQPQPGHVSNTNLDSTPPRIQQQYRHHPSVASSKSPSSSVGGAQKSAAMMVTPDATPDSKARAGVSSGAVTGSDNNNRRVVPASSTTSASSRSVTPTTFLPSTTAVSAVWACGSAPDYLFETASTKSNSNMNRNTSLALISADDATALMMIPGDTCETVTNMMIHNGDTQQQRNMYHNQADMRQHQSRSWRLQKIRNSITARGEYVAIDDRLKSKSRSSNRRSGGGDGSSIEDETLHTGDAMETQRQQHQTSFDSNMSSSSTRYRFKIKKQQQQKEDPSQQVSSSTTQSQQQQKSSSSRMRRTLKRFAA